MKFCLIDRVERIEPGQKIVAYKAVSLAEEYLGDHFPTFPVLPGVMMIEALTQAAAWLTRITLDFTPPVILLREAKNVRYKSFVPPGRLLRVELTAKTISPESSEFMGSGSVDGSEVVNARLALLHRTTTVGAGGSAAVDDRLRAHWRQHWCLLYTAGTESAAAVAT